MTRSIRLVFEILLVFVIALLLSIVAEQYCTNAIDINAIDTNDVVYSVDGVYISIPSSQEGFFLQSHVDSVIVNRETWVY